MNCQPPRSANQGARLNIMMLPTGIHVVHNPSGVPRISAGNQSEIAAGATIVINPIPVPSIKRVASNKFAVLQNDPESRPDKHGADGNHAGCFEAQSLHNEASRESQ